MTTAALSRKFDYKMYTAALTYYGLPVNYNRTFKQKLLTDRETGETLLDQQGKPKTTLVSCSAQKESAQGNSIWVQVNRPFDDAAIKTTQNGQYAYPKKAANTDIQWIANVTLDFEYPPDPRIAHTIGEGLADYLIAQGLAEPGLPGEDSGGGDHFVLPIPPIETTKETAKMWNDAVYEVVKKHIQPEFDRLVKRAGITMDLGGFDISRVLSAPGTWRPYRPDKQDCDALKAGYLRQWLAPYVDGRYPERKECAKLAVLIRDTYEQLKREAQTPKPKPVTPIRATNSSLEPSEWLYEYAKNHPKSNRSTLFQSLVSACYRKFGEEVTTSLSEKINDLAGAKYNGRLDTEFKRSLDLARKTPEFPEVIINKQLPEMVQDALNALMLVEKEYPTIFVQELGLVKVIRNKAKNKPIIKQLGEAEFRNALCRTAHYYRLKEKSGEFFKVPIAPPKDIVEAIIHPEDPSNDWPFPVLDAIVGIPIIRPDGSIVAEPGYDEATQLFYLPTSDLEHCKIPENPTQEDAKHACMYLQNIIAEFPFITPVDFANALGAIITPFIRQTMSEEDDVPIASIDAASPGTGKGLLTSLIFIIATGHRMAALPAPEAEEEWDKKIVTELMEGNTLIAIDNVPGVLHSSKLEIVLTTRSYKGRVLGRSQSVTVENRATWIVTGNNLKIAGDLAERCYWIRMVATTSNPEARTFKIPDLMKYVKEHRCELVTAILTMIRAWYVDGCPKDTSLANFRTFTTWSNTVGSILHYAGVDGFLSDRAERKNEHDEERKQWTTFLRAWYKRYGSAETTIAIIKQVVSAGSDAGSDEEKTFYESLPEYLQGIYGESPNKFAIKFGKALQARAERRYGIEDLYLERGKNTRTNVATWKVIAGSAGSIDNLTHEEKNTSEKNNFLYEDEKNAMKGNADNSHHSMQDSNVNTVEKRTNEPVKPSQQNTIFNQSAGSRESLPASSQEWEEETL